RVPGPGRVRIFVKIVTRCDVAIHARRVEPERAILRLGRRWRWGRRRDCLGDRGRRRGRRRRGRGGAGGAAGGGGGAVGGAVAKPPSTVVVKTTARTRFIPIP